MPYEARYFSLQQTRETFLRHFLFVCLLVLTFYLIFDTYHQIYIGAFTDLITGIAVGISYFSLRRHGIKTWHIHLTLMGGICLFGPLLVIEAFGDTGLYWLPTLPVITFMLGGTRVGLMWAGVYFLCLFLSMALAGLGFISLQYTWDQTFFMMFVTSFMGIISYFFVRYLEGTETMFLMQQEQLENALLQAQQANQSKSVFLSTMNHELRTPLHGIIGMQELLAKENRSWSDEQRECLQLSLQSSRALKDLLNDVLDLAKIEANQMHLDQRPLDTLELVRESLIPFAFHSKEKGIELNLVIENVPKTILGDVMRLRQVLFNLLGNALKFTEQGSVTLKVEQDSLEAGALKFSVKDTGIGIPLAEQDEIFDPFYQCSNSPHGIKGTGLGTSIIKHSVELMGGQVSVESKAGHGCCFTFTLPYKGVDEDTYSLNRKVEDIIVTDNSQKEYQRELKLNKKLSVLLVEDDEVGQRLAVKTLGRAGLKVSIASNGQEALGILEKRTFDVMLTDLRMPYMDGITLTKAIREKEQGSSQQLFIIGLSADALSSVIDEALAAGINIFLPKPIEPNAILETVLAAKADT